tara:strand:+ start:8810 stop:9160 length:351 start_codon:yes stop_codon:yes gene_type:complete
MATNIKTATVTGSGQLLDYSRGSGTGSTSIGNVSAGSAGMGDTIAVGTRILGITAAVTGTCNITDTWTSVNTTKTRIRIRFAGNHDAYFGEQGVKFLGKMMVSAPTSGSTVMIYYG